MTTNNPAMGSSRSKSRMSMTLRTPPAKQMRAFCANMPTTSEAASAMSTGACLLPGPVSLAANTPAINPMIISAASARGSTAPADLFVSRSRPSEYPFFRNSVPVAMPSTKPIRPT